MITVHTNNCGHCNNGKGKQNPKGSLNGVWLDNHLGLKNAYKEAEKLAKSINYKYRLCSTCIGNNKTILNPQPLKSENLIFNFHGVYKIFCYNKKPLEIGRLLKKDKSGLLYIGESTDIASRLLNFLTNLKNKESNSHTAGFKMANRHAVVKFIKNKQLYFTCYESLNSKAAEQAELNQYISIFGETPPLNK